MPRRPELVDQGAEPGAAVRSDLDVDGSVDRVEAGGELSAAVAVAGEEPEPLTGVVEVILAGHPQHQCPDGLWGGWAALPWVGPTAGNEVGVPAQQGPRRDKPQPAQVRGQQLA